MTGIEGGVSLGTAVAGAPSKGGFHGGEISSLSTSPGMVGTSHSVEIPGFASVNVSSAVTDTRMGGLDTVNPFAGLEMYSPQLDTASVLGPDASATAKNFEGFDSLTEATSVAQKAWGSPMQDFDIQLAADEVARAAWDKSEPYSVLTEANKVVEDAVNKSAVHVMSPFEVIGLLSVGAKAQQALSNEAPLEHSIPGIEIAAPVIEFPSAESMQITSPAELLVSPEVENVVQIAGQEVSPITDILSESSDEAVAARVISLSEELGVQLDSDTQSVVTEALGIVNMTFIETTTASEVTAVDPLVETAQATEVEIDPTTGEEVLLMDQQVTEHHLAQKTVVKDEPKEEEKGFEEDRVANDERRRVAEESYTAAMQKKGEESDEVLAQRVVKGYYAGVAGNIKADSEIVRGSNSDETKEYWIPDQVERENPGTPAEALHVINSAIVDHTAVRRGRNVLDQRAVLKVLDGGSRRHVIDSSLAA